MAKKKPKTIIYCRKSQESEDRQALSIPAQINECLKLAEKHHINKDDIEIIQESQSAKQPGRPFFNEMMAKINKGEVESIVCWKLDRLARNPVDGPSIIWMLEQKKVNKIITISHSFYPDDNHILMYLEFGMAAQYSRDLSTNIRRGNKAKLEQGWWTGVAPLGYLNNSDKHGPPIIKDPERFELVRKMWDMMLTGNYSIPKLRTIVNEEWGLRTLRRNKSGGGKLGTSSIYDLLRNPFYYGVMRRGGETYAGKHEPMISKEEFDMVQAKFEKSYSTKPKNRDFAFRGIIKCAECGCSITSEDTTNRHGTTYTYYRCTRKRNQHNYKCKQRPVRKEALESQVAEAIESFEIPTEFKNWGVKYIQMMHEKESSNNKQVIKNKHTLYEQIDDKLNKLLDLRLRDILSDDDYLKEKDKLVHEKNNVEMHISNAKSESDKWRELAEKTFDFACHAHEWFKKGSMQEKNEILLAIGSKFTLDDGQLKIEWHKPLEIFRENHQEIYEAKKGLEPSKNKVIISNIEVLSKNKELLEKTGLEPRDLRSIKSENGEELEVIPVWWS